MIICWIFSHFLLYNLDSMKRGLSELVSYNDLFAQATAMFDEGKLDEAEDILRQLGVVSQDNPFVLNLLGLIAQAKGLHEQACSCFSAALRIQPDRPDFCYNLAFSLQNSGQYHDALRTYQKVLALKPDIKEAYNEIACIYEVLGQKDEALYWWHKALQMAPDYVIAAINLAYSQKDWGKLENLSTLYPKEALVWYDLAQMQYGQNDFIGAQNNINKALELQPNFDDCNYLAGLIALRLDNKAQALEYFIKAEQINDNHIGAKLKVADLYSLQGYFNKAEKRYKRLIEMDKDNFDVHNNYAEMLYRQNRLHEALEEYRAAILINPQSAAACNNLGAILRDMKDYDEALGLFFNALTYSPDMSDISLNIAETLVLLARDDKEKALKIAANWLKNYPNNIYAEQVNHALKGEKIANNNLYTERLFDAFADNYELVMQNLDYSAPMAIKQFAGVMQGTIADLGCGSGLAGQAVKSVQNKIIGVDISEKMLALASQKQVYDELIKSDIIEFLQERHDYDWIMAADVLGYIGDLSEFIKLCQGKKLVFTIEADENITDYRLDITSRYKHNPAYVEKLLRDNGFKDIQSQKAILRQEAGCPVEAVVFVLK